MVYLYGPDGRLIRRKFGFAAAVHERVGRDDPDGPTADAIGFTIPTECDYDEDDSDTKPPSN